MKVLLYNPDSTPAVVETSDQEKLTALVVMAFGLITGAAPRTEGNYKAWIGKAVAVVGPEALTSAYPGLQLKMTEGLN